MTGRPIITDTAPAFQSPLLLFLLLPFFWREEREKKEEVQIIVNPCFDALSSLLGCCLNMSLFCPPSPPAPPHFLLQPQSLSLICMCCPPLLLLYLSLSLANYFGLRWGISIVVSPLQFPRHLHYSCVLVAVCVRGKKESGKVEAATDENHRADSNQNKTTLSKISLGTSFDLSLQQKNKNKTHI